MLKSFKTDVDGEKKSKKSKIKKDKSISTTQEQKSPHSH